MPRISHDEGPLLKLVHDLEKNWQSTAMYWKDKARRNFEKTYLDDLRPDVKRAADSIGRINRLLRKAVRECS